MNNELVKFYKELLEALDLEVTKDGQILVSGSEKPSPLTINGLPVYLPTDENIRTAVTLIDDIPQPVKILFNPMDEDAIKGENESLRKLRSIIELRLTGAIYQLGETLLNLVIDTEKIVNDPNLLKFISLLNRYKTPGTKHIVDEKTIDSWIKLYKSILTEHYAEANYVKIYSKRGGKINDIKYNRINILGFPFLEKLHPINANKEKFLGLKIRNKDKHDYESLFEFIFQTDIEQLLEGFKYGSLNKIAPGFHALMLLYDDVYKRFKPVIDALFDLGVEDREAEYLNLKPLPIDIGNLGDFIDNMANEIRKIPREKDLVNNTQPSANTQTTTTTQPVGSPTNMTQTTNTNNPWEAIKKNITTKIPTVNTYNNAAINTPIQTQPTPSAIVNPYSRGPVGAPIPRPINTISPRYNPTPSPMSMGIPTTNPTSMVRRVSSYRPGQPTNQIPQGYVNPYLAGRR